MRFDGEERTVGKSNQRSYAGKSSEEGGDPMDENMYPKVTPELAKTRSELAPETYAAFHNFSRQVFAEGALSEKTKQLIAVAVAHVTQCPYCIDSHTKLAGRKGATPEEIMEAIWVAAEMRAGGAYAHSILAIHAMHESPDANK
jgi:AhpD family alkylhydroperoxidase